MNARILAGEAAERLAAAGIEDARFEAEYLVRSAAGLTRAAYFAGAPVGPDVPANAARFVDRRAEREPAAYITGSREFWGMAFEVGPGALVPRPETELLVELALRDAAALARPVIADIGTGTGAIAVAIAKELAAAGRSGAHVIAIDVSGEALAYARRNAATHGANLTFLAGDLASPLRRADIVLANLPYIPTEEIDALEPEVSRWEPRVALDGGEDGFALIRRLLDECQHRLRPRLLALEVGFAMAPTAAALARERGATVEVHRDLAGIERVVCCRWV